ncbi:MAG: flagellar hook-associated protein FlgK [Deltaproteobacteria bacterium RIFOXYD12_FULL_55_16]|nr:MAG: flagellar hook-associated protein FlgK [Deltaproteobacteria bacterium RIFOXYD12_FULL_55_16]
MSGISQVLSIAKEALLAHQLSIQVAAHNIANVDTPGYTRQSLRLETNNAAPVSAGLLGGGVKASVILRNYDQFMVQRQAGQESDLGSLQAQQESMRLVETVFNEAPGLAINDLLSQFWSSWQNLADNPEISATRQATIQSSQLLIDQLHTMSEELTQTKTDIGISLDTAIGDVNTITSQIASLNVQISGAESAAGQANDLRDKRDSLVQELSQLLDVSFFEDKNGGYSVLMNEGHTLVESSQAARVDWENNELVWINEDSNGNETRQTVGRGAELGGKIGGWLEVRGNLSEGDPDNFLGRLNAFANAMIREINQQHTQGVGVSLFADTLTGAEQASNVARLTSTVDAVTDTATISAGSITINDREVGEIIGGADQNGLAMSKADNAVTAINAAEAGVEARLTTLVAGVAVNATNLTVGDTISFTLNGVAVGYTVVAGDVGSNANFATNLAAEVNSDLATYNSLASTTNPVTIQATAGTGVNGGPANSLVFYNTNEGDSSSIAVANLSGVFAGAATIANLGLNSVTGNTYTADATHNTGQITLFSANSFTLTAGVNDSILAQLGLDAVPSDSQAGDGAIQYGPEIGHQGPLLSGYDYFDQIDTTGSFEIWIYNNSGTLAMPRPVTVSLARAYSLDDVVNIINKTVAAATSSSGWVTASNNNNSLRLTPDASHQFAFANDSSNFLQAAGLNTFFSGSSAADIDLNSVITDDLNNLAAATVGQFGQIFRGDNSNSLKIVNIQYDEYITYTGGSQDTLDGFYNTLVGQVANTTRTIGYSYDSAVLVSAQLREIRDSVSGVSLDEEMASLIKYQQAYTAATRLITMSDEMLKDLLDSVR